MFAIILNLILSLGAINALVPIVIILILLVASAGLNRGYSIFNLFGLATLAGINPGGKASIAGKTSFIVLLMQSPKIGEKLHPGTKIKARVSRRFNRFFTRRTLIRQQKLADKPPKAPPTGKLGKAADQAKKIAKPIARATFMDKPSTTLKKVGGKIASNKKIRGAATSVVTSTYNTKAYKIARKPFIKGSQVANTGKRFYRNNIQGTKTLKAAKVAGAFAANPVIGLGYVAIKSGTRLGHERSGALNARGAGSNAADVTSKKPKAHSIVSGDVKAKVKTFATTPLFMASPGLYAAHRARVTLRNAEQKTNDIKASAGSQQREIANRESRGLRTDKGLGIGHAAKAISDASARAGGYENLSRQEKRSLNKEVNKQLDDTYKKDRRTVMGAAAIGTANIIKEARKGFQQGGVGGAASSVGSKIKSDTQNMGLEGHSIGTAKVARAALDSAFIARSKLDTSIFDDRIRTDHHKELLLGLHEKYAAQGKNPDRLRDHLDHINNELSTLQNRVNAPTVAQVAGTATAPNPKGPKYGQDEIDKLNRIKAAMALNPSAPEDIVKRQLATDSEPMVRAAAMKNRVMSPEDLRTYTKQETDRTDILNNDIERLNRTYQAQHAAGSPQADATKRDLDSRISDLVGAHERPGVNDVLSSISSNPNTDPDEIKKLYEKVKDTDAMFARSALANATTSSSLDSVKSQVAQHENTPEDVLMELAQDPNAGIRKVARVQLRKRFGKTVD